MIVSDIAFQKTIKEWDERIHYLWPYVNQALLRINMAEDLNFLTPGVNFTSDVNIIFETAYGTYRKVHS